MKWQLGLGALACAMITCSATAWAQPPPAPAEPPPPATEEPPPPLEDEPPLPEDEEEPAPPPPGYDRRQPPPGYGPPPGHHHPPQPGYRPGYGPPPGYGHPGGYGPPPGYGHPPGYGPPPGYGYGYRPEPPRELEDHGGPPPPGYRRDTRIRKGLVIGGATTLGALWLVSSVFAGALMDEANGFSSQEEDYAPLFIPVVGPFVAIGTLESEGIGTVMLMLDGVGQVGGLAMLIAGVAAKESYFVRDFSVGEHRVEVRAQPLVGTQGGGMALTGTF